MVRMSLDKHIPSHVVVAGHRGLISYEGQPTTCYSCNEPVHIKTECPHRRRERPVTRPTTMLSSAEAAAGAPTSQPITSMDSDTEMAAPDSKEAVTSQSPVSAHMYHKKAIATREVETASDMEEDQLMDNVTKAEGDRLQVEGRRRRHSNRQPISSQEVTDERKEDQTEKPPVRRQQDFEVNEWSIVYMKATDDNTSGRRKGGSEDGGTAPQGGTPEEVTATSSKRHKN